MIQPEDKTQVSEQSKPALKRAMEVLYGENFEPMFKMFESNGPEGFPKAMSAAINSVLERISAEGEIPDEIKAEVAIAIFTMLTEDIIDAGFMEVTGEMVQGALQMFTKDYVMKHPESYDPAAVKQAEEQVRSEYGIDGMEQPGGAGMEQAPQEPRRGGLLNG